MTRKRIYIETVKYINKGEKSVVDEINEFCKSKGISRSALTNELYKEFLEKHK